MKRKQTNLKYLLFVNLFSLIGFYTFSPLYALFASSLGIAPKDIAFMWSGYSLLMAVFVLIFGKVENRRSNGKMLVIGYFGCSVGAVLLLMAHDQASLMFALIVNAIAASMTLPAYKTLYAKNESKGKESEQWSWLDAGTTFSIAIGSALGGLIIAHYGFEGILIAMASIQLTAALVALRVIYKMR